MNVQDIIISNPDILSGQPVFRGTRVPVETLFDHLEKGISLKVFLEDFPTVSEKQAKAALEIAEKILTSKNLDELYETAA